MMQSAEINEIAKALAAAQSEIRNPTKTRTAKIASAKGSYSYKYADIADVLDAALPVLSKHGIAVMQPTVIVDGSILVRTKLAHASGQWMESEYPVCAINGDHKAMGAAMTYSRRYALSSMIGVASDEDTDSEGAAPAHKAPVGQNGVSLITDEQVATLRALVEETETDVEKFCRYMRVRALPEIAAGDFDRAVAALDAKRGGGK